MVGIISYGAYIPIHRLQRSAIAQAWGSAAGAGDVTAAANLGDNLLIRGDGAGKGVQNSGISIDDSDEMSGGGVGSMTLARISGSTYSTTQETMHRRPGTPQTLGNREGWTAPRIGHQHLGQVKGGGSWRLAAYQGRGS